MIKIIFNFIRSMYHKYNNFNPYIVIYLMELDTTLVEYLDLGSLFELKTVCRDTQSNKFLHNEIINKYRVSFFDNTFIPIDIIRGLPYLTYKRSFNSGTDYIDSIYSKDMEFPVMIGIDEHKRPFITIKYKFDGSDKFNGRITVFQRFINNKNKWVKGGYEGPLLTLGSIMLDKHDKLLFIENLSRLLSGEKVLIKNFNKYYLGDYDYNHNLSDMDEMKCDIY